ncbi:hypothetical protein AX14_001701 [Amanita brunnescens Koide BX004]|nr:hypothetical protein AX14_001701 [Amanita brunnescens Koide BX004]
MSLSELFAKSLSAASKVTNLPTVERETQELIQSCLQDLIMIQSRLVALSIFSPNELLEDIGTTDLVYLFVPYVHSEVLDRIKTVEITERLQVLDRAQRLLRDFASSIENYEIVPESERALYQRKASAVRDPKQKRELKIMQFKTEKDLRAKLEAIRDRRGWRSVTAGDGNNFDLISMLLPSGAGSRPSEDEEDLDSEIEDALREAILVLLRLLYTQAHNRMDNMEQELDLLRNASTPDRRPEEDVRREQRRTADEDMWRVDAQRGFDGKGSLLDSSGKVRFTLHRLWHISLRPCPSLFDLLRFFHRKLLIERAYNPKFSDQAIDFPP